MTGIPSILRQILQTKREEIAEGRLRVSADELRDRVVDLPPCRGFEAALADKAAHGPAVIAEIKKASPSAGVIREHFDPESIAQSYEQAGAACLSVLTDRKYFQGSDVYLQAAVSASTLPVLRKDFIVDPWQVLESRAMGADCILLIVAALSAGQLKDLADEATAAGLDVLVEVHNEAELRTALTTDARLIGVNNRDLHQFTTDLGVSERLRPLVPAERCMITESGINTRMDVQRMLENDIHAFLVGEAFMRADNPGAALRGLFFT
jgi:indole-3-glycerol phosphate synthase